MWGFFSANIGIYYLCLTFFTVKKNTAELFRTMLHWEGSQFHLFQILMRVCGKPLNALFFSLVQ